VAVLGDVYNQSTFLLLKAAYLYYIKDLSQNDIAKLLQVSVTTVSRLLKRAKEEKIIEFVIRDPYVECIRLGEKLKEAFGLKDVVVAPSVTDAGLSGEGANPDNVKKLVALEGARYLQRIIHERDVLGVAWGSTIYHMINYLNPSQKVDATFVSLHGSISNCVDEWDVRTLVSRMARAFSGRNYFLMAEGLMSSKRSAYMIKREKNIKAVFEMFKNINISITGMGSFYPTPTSVLATPSYVSEAELQSLLGKNTVGDIMLRFFTWGGKECDTELIDRTISIDLEQYRKIETKIVLASGEEKLYPVLESMKGKLLDVLITDYELANMILKANDQPVSDAGR
jgi:DNA-binding transcriptional regulator LsrR (DeoR family)